MPASTVDRQVARPRARGPGRGARARARGRRRPADRDAPPRLPAPRAALRDARRRWPAQRRSTRPARSSGCTRYGPGHLAARRGVGKSFPGFARPAGSNARRSALHQRRDRRGVNISGIAQALSTPTPCSPVIVPPRVDAGLEDRLGAAARARSASPRRRVVEHQRVQVAVAGVEDIADAQAVLALELVDAAQDLAAAASAARRRPARSSSALIAPHRGERRLAALPDERALGVVARDAHLARAAARGRSPRPRPMSSSTCAADAVELDEQHRACAARVARRAPRASAASIVSAVHDLDRRRAGCRRR